MPDPVRRPSLGAYWRKLLLVLPLALGLLAQAHASVVMSCGSLAAATHEMRMEHAKDGGLHAAHGAERTASADSATHGHQHGASAQPHSCSTCAFCFDIALTGLPLPRLSHAARPAPALAPDYGVASAVAGRIERPPRKVFA